MRKSFFTVIAASTIALASTAQTLTEEVIIDREITPVIRTVTRPTWANPSLLTPSLKFKKLSFNEYVGTAEITRSITPLAPVAWADSVMRTPYRGYATIGYFPAFNINGAAGYRLLHDNRRDLGVKFSYDGSSWGGWDSSDGKFKQNQLSFGIDGTLKFRPGTLTADFGYTYSSTDTPDGTDYRTRGTQAINMVDLGVMWTPANTTSFGWNAYARLGYGGFSKDKTGWLGAFVNRGDNFRLDPVKDVTFKIGTDLSYALGNNSGIALGLAFDLRHVNNFTQYYPVALYSTETEIEVPALEIGNFGTQNLGIVTVQPAYTFVSGKTSGRIGLRLDVRTGGLNSGVEIAPDIEVQWAATPQIAVYARATGGEVMNSNTQLWQSDPWMTGVLAFERSHVNADIQLGLTYGSYRGFWGNIHVGWSSVSRYGSPVLVQTSDDNAFNTWALSSFNGFNYGLELGYAWRDMVTVTGHVLGASQGKYYCWQDGAKWDLGIAAKVRPIKALQIEVGYDVRLDRIATLLTPALASGMGATYNSIDYQLHNTSNLFAGASYGITDAFDVYLKAQNLLNHHWEMTPGVRSRGIHGLLGVQLKF